MFTHNSKLTSPPLQSLTQYKIRPYSGKVYDTDNSILAHNLEVITAKAGGIYSKN